MEKKISSTFQLVLAALLGVLAGLLLGSRAHSLGAFAALLIQLLKILAVPLLFFAILDAFCKVDFPLQSGFRLLFWSTLNGMVAAGIAVLIAYGFRLGAALNVDQLIVETAGMKELPHVHFLGAFSFLSSYVIEIALGTMALGMGVRQAGRRWKGVQRLFERFSELGLRWTSRMLRLLIFLVPLAVFCIVAQVTAIRGLSFFSVLGGFVLLVLSGILLQCLVYYSALLHLFAQVSPWVFWRQMGEVWTTAFGTGSSLATLPVTLRVLQDRMKVSPESARLAACVGTNFNHVGILLYEAVAALFVAQAYGVSLTPWKIGKLLGTSALAAIGIAGVPEAGLITLSLVLSSAGLPLTLVPVLMAVDWFIGRFRAMCNVTSDVVVALLLDQNRAENCAECTSE